MDRIEGPLWTVYTPLPSSVYSALGASNGSGAQLLPLSPWMLPLPVVSSYGCVLQQSSGATKGVYGIASSLRVHWWAKSSALGFPAFDVGSTMGGGGAGSMARSYGTSAGLQLASLAPLRFGEHDYGVRRGYGGSAEAGHGGGSPTVKAGHYEAVAWPKGAK